MNYVFICVLLIFIVSPTFCYWESDRQNTENPQNDNPNCDDYCKRMPDYMNWREGLDFRERQGIEYVIRDTDYGAVQGLSIPGVYDTSSFVSMFLGIPYAKPPVGEDMFKVGHYQQHEPCVLRISIRKSIRIGRNFNTMIG